MITETWTTPQCPAQTVMLGDTENVGMFYLYTCVAEDKLVVLDVATFTAFFSLLKMKLQINMEFIARVYETSLRSKGTLARCRSKTRSR
jgi:hypothetical protein